MKKIKSRRTITRFNLTGFPAWKQNDQNLFLRNCYHWLWSLKKYIPFGVSQKIKNEVIWIICLLLMHLLSEATIIEYLDTKIFNFVILFRQENILSNLLGLDLP